MLNTSSNIAIKDLLKSLKLTGIMESLDDRNQEAIINKMSYIDFMTMILQDEILRREDNRFNYKIKQSCIRPNKTIEKFDFTFNPTINQQQIKDALTCKFIDDKTCLLICGPCGTGKSHLAQAVGFSALQRGIDVLFTTQDKINKELARARAVGTYDNKFRSFIKPPLLIIDDFGIKPFKQNQEEDLHDIIAARYENNATIITSNLDFSEWHQIFSNKILGAAVIDRIRHGAKSIVLNGKSYRSKI